MEKSPHLGGLFRLAMTPKGRGRWYGSIEPHFDDICNAYVVCFFLCFFLQMSWAFLPIFLPCQNWLYSIWKLLSEGQNTSKYVEMACVSVGAKTLCHQGKTHWRQQRHTKYLSAGCAMLHQKQSSIAIVGIPYNYKCWSTSSNKTFCFTWFHSIFEYHILV